MSNRISYSIETLKKDCFCALCNPCDAVFQDPVTGSMECRANDDWHSERCLKRDAVKDIDRFFNRTLRHFLKETLGDNYD